MKVNINLPSFTGTYNSVWNNDDNWYYEMEHSCGLQHVDGWAFDSQAFLRDLSEAYTDFIEGLYREHICDGISLKFEATTSPREYNYTTDKIYADLIIRNKNVFERKVKQLMEANRDKLSRIIKEHHTSCSGFVSFMSNDIDVWKKTFMSDDLVLSYLMCYLTMISLGLDDMPSIDCMAYDFVDVMDYSYWYPESEDAIMEWEEYQRAEAERAWDREHLLELPFEYA